MGKIVFAPIHEDGLFADMGVFMSKQCQTCQHLGRPITCKIYPDGIPEEFLDGTKDDPDYKPI